MTLYVEAGFDLAVLAGKFGGALAFTLTETGGGAHTGVVSVPTGTRFLRTDGSSITKPDAETAYALGYSSVLTDVTAAMNAIGVGTYAATFDVPTERVILTCGGAAGVTSFAISAISECAKRVLGHTTNKSSQLQYSGDRAPWYWIKTAQGILSDYQWDVDEDGQLGEDNVSHGGSSYGISEDECATLYDATIPLEPRAAVWNEFVTASNPFTWQRLYRHVRNVEPVLLDFNDSPIVRKFFIRFRREGRLFAPQLRADNVWDYADIQIRARLLGKL